MSFGGRRSPLFSAASLNLGAFPAWSRILRTGGLSGRYRGYLLPLRRIQRSGKQSNMAPGQAPLRGPVGSNAIGAFGFPQRYIIVFLTFLCTSVCYIERVGFSVAYTSMAIRVGVDQATKGWVLSAFYYGYASSQIPGSWAAQKYGGRRVLTLSFVFWSILCVLTPTDPGPLFSLVAIRLLVGVAQGFIFPSIHTVLAQWIPPQEKSRSVSLTTSGMYFGAGLAMLYLPGVVAVRGPQSVFQIVAVMGAAWAAVWVKYSTDPPGGATGFPAHATLKGHHHSNGSGTSGSMELLQAPGSSHALDVDPEKEREREERKAQEEAIRARNSREAKIPWLRIMMNLPVWAIVVNNFTFHYALYVLMNWLPTYFDQGLHASLHSLGASKSVPYFIMFLFSNVGGVAADFLITRRFLSVTATRKLLNTLGFLASAAALALMPVLSSVRGALLCSSITLGACALARAGFAVNHMDIAPRYAGVVMGVSNTAGTLAGIVGVAATGLILEAAGGSASSSSGWPAVFMTPAVLCIFSALIFCIFATGERIFD